MQRYRGWKIWVCDKDSFSFKENIETDAVKIYDAFYRFHSVLYPIFSSAPSLFMMKNISTIEHQGWKKVNISLSQPNA